MEKLLRRGKGWLSSHPEMKLITRRYFNKKKGLANKAIQRLLDTDEIESVVDGVQSEVDVMLLEQEGTKTEVGALEVKEKRVPLKNQRLDAVVQAVKNSGAKSVLDLGCGEGRLLSKLINENQITKLTGLDVSIYALERARDRLRLDRIPEYKRDKVILIQGSLTYRDKRIEGYDAACVVEVMEHMDIGRLPAFERVVFEFASPQTIIVTMPNKEYNKNYVQLGAKTMRHHDHRFEWTREEFRQWAERVCKQYGYSVVYSDIGEIDQAVGAPTQMGVFTKCE